MPYPHLPDCPHGTHGPDCFVYETTACTMCGRIVAAKAQGRDDMLALLAADPNPQVALAAQNAATLCIYTLPEPLDEM